MSSYIKAKEQITKLGFITSQNITIIISAAITFIILTLVQREILADVPQLAANPEVADVIFIILAVVAFKENKEIQAGAVAGAGISLVNHLMKRAGITV